MQGKQARRCSERIRNNYPRTSDPPLIDFVCNIADKNCGRSTRPHHCLQNMPVHGLIETRKAQNYSDLQKCKSRSITPDHPLTVFRDVVSEGMPKPKSSADHQ